MDPRATEQGPAPTRCATLLPAPTAFRAAFQAMVTAGLTRLSLNHALDDVGRFPGEAVASGATEDGGVEVRLVVPPGDGTTVLIDPREDDRPHAEVVEVLVAAVRRAEQGHLRAIEGAASRRPVAPASPRPVILRDVRRAVADGRPAEAVRLARALQEDGDGRGAVLVAQMHSQGLGVAEDPVAAAAWYRTAVEVGEAPGAYGLGALHALGRGVDRDLEQALLWYRRADQWGDPGGAVMVGVMHARGEGVPADAAEGVRHLRRAVARGSVEALVKLGRWTGTGAHGPADPVTGTGYLLRVLRRHPEEVPAEEHDRAEAVETTRQLMDPVGDLAGTGDPDALFHVAAVALLSADTGEGDAAVLDLLRSVAEAGHPAALRRLAELEPDAEQAREHLHRAAAAGDAEAQYLWGAQAASVDRGPRDAGAAEQWLRRAAQQEHAGAQTLLAELVRGTTDASVHRERLGWLHRAAEYGWRAAMPALADALADGDGTDVDAPSAVRWYLAALYRGNGDGLHRLHQLAHELTPTRLLAADRLAGGDGSWGASLVAVRSVDGSSCCADLLAEHGARFGPVHLEARATG
jgi:uncharacterized protein